MPGGPASLADIPRLADNGHSVPLKISVESPMTAADHVRSITLLSEKNPRPVMATFRLSPNAGRAEVITRVRLNGSQRLLALAQRRAVPRYNHFNDGRAGERIAAVDYVRAQHIRRQMAAEMAGAMADLDALVGTVHGAGMSFILDMVVNHAGDGARIAIQQPDWFHDPGNCASLGDPAVYCPYRAGVHDFAQENPTVASYLDLVSTGWVSRVALENATSVAALLLTTESAIGEMPPDKNDMVTPAVGMQDQY